MKALGVALSAWNSGEERNLPNMRPRRVLRPWGLPHRAEQQTEAVGESQEAPLGPLASDYARKSPGWPIREDAYKQGRPDRTPGVWSGTPATVWSPTPGPLWKRFLSCGARAMFCLYPSPRPPHPQGLAGLLASSLGRELPMAAAAPAMWAVGAADRLCPYRSVCSCCCRVPA